MTEFTIKPRLDVSKFTHKDKVPDGKYNYLGKTIGSKTIIEYLGVYTRDTHAYTMWKYECECGATGCTNEHTLCHKSTEQCYACMHYKRKKPNPVDCGDYYSLTTSCGYEYYIDKSDYELIKPYTWHKHKDGYLRTRYDVVNGKNKYILLHNLLFGRFDASEGDVDHINRLPYDNRRENLRLVTHGENMRNINKKSNSTHGIMGIHYSKLEKKWKAYMVFDKVRINLGTYKTKDEAIVARLTKEYELLGEKSYQYEDMIRYGIVDGG